SYSNPHNEDIWAIRAEQIPSASPKRSKNKFVCRRDLIFQDDSKSKQRTKIIERIVDELFDHRILPEEDDAKFADVWPIENVWGILKEKVREKLFPSFEQLKMRLNKEWKKIAYDDCKT
ncbi:unnamed protein product, partial [Rotaria sp. Silwood2]